MEKEGDMATYSGNDAISNLVEKDGKPFPPEPSLRLANKSPAGFSWGYAGSGPAQLALALLYDVTGDEKVALANFQAFKWEFVVKWGEKWTITSQEIKKWVARVSRD